MTEAEASSQTDATESARTPVDRLLARMDKGGDFPALSRTITEINHAVGDENSRANRITEIILRDIALTKKLLRLVNAAHYGSFGNQPISTISRAVVILGFNAVRDAAISLMLFEHMQNRAQIDTLRAEAVDSFYRGVLGRMLAASAGVRDGEEAFISALFRDLGRLMARFHFYDQTLEVERLMTEDMLDENSASRRVFEVDYDELGIAIAKHWHFPGIILHAMEPLDDAPMRRQGGTPGDRLRVVANLARELHRGLAVDTPEERMQSVTALFERYREAAQITKDSLMEIAHKAAHTLQAESMILNVDARKSPTVKRMLQAPVDAKTEQEAEAIEEQIKEIDQAAGGDLAGDLAGDLTQGMQDMTAMMLGQFNLADIFKLVAELLYRTELFDHVLVCMLDRPSQSLVARVGLGINAARMRAGFRIPLAFSPDVFHAALANAQDVLIADSTAENIRGRIPGWYARAFHAHSFLLLPIVLGNKPIGMIYVDKLDQPMRIPSQVLGLLKALRNQSALAVRQKI